MEEQSIKMLYLIALVKSLRENNKIQCSKTYFIVRVLQFLLKLFDYVVGFRDFTSLLLKHLLQFFNVLGFPL